MTAYPCLALFLSPQCAVYGIKLVSATHDIHSRGGVLDGWIGQPLDPGEPRVLRWSSETPIVLPAPLAFASIYVVRESSSLIPAWEEIGFIVDTNGTVVSGSLFDTRAFLTNTANTTGTANAA